MNISKSSGFIWLVIPLTFGLTMGVFEAFGLHTTVLTDLFLLPYSLLALAIQIWLHIRRLHDLDKSGQHALWLLVPLVGAFYFLYLLDLSEELTEPTSTDKSLL